MLTGHPVSGVFTTRISPRVRQGFSTSLSRPAGPRRWFAMSATWTSGLLVRGAQETGGGKVAHITL